MTREDFKRHLQEKNPDVLAFSKRKKFRKLIRVITIDVILMVFAIFTVEEMAKPDLAIPTYATVAVLCILLTVISKPRGLIFSKLYVGVIEKAQISTHMAAVDSNPRYIRMQNFWVLTIKDEQGKLYEIELLPKYASCYLVGDCVAVVPAITYPFLMNPPKNRKTVCWWCGSINPPDTRECMNCNRVYFD